MTKIRFLTKTTSDKEILTKENKVNQAPTDNVLGPKTFEKVNPKKSIKVKVDHKEKSAKSNSTT